jgi:hypothetical protein
MVDSFQKDIESLKSLDPQDLYNFFHQTQSEVLYPQWKSHLNFLLGDLSVYQIKQLYGPKKPCVPDTYAEEVSTEVNQAREGDVLVLNQVIQFLNNPLRVFNEARTNGFHAVVVHDVPRGGSFKYQSHPEVKFFSDRIDRQSGNSFLDQIIDHASETGWRLTSDSTLDFNYSTAAQKEALVKMELSLDLIESAFGQKVSNFESIKNELERWCFYPESWVRVTGCSRWLVFKIRS